MSSADKLKFTFTVDPDNAGPLIIAALRLDATIDQCVWEQMLPYHKNKPSVPAPAELFRLPSVPKRVGRPSKNGAPKRTIKAKTNGPSLYACLARLREAGDKGVEWEELKRIYKDGGALPQGINSALRTLATKKWNKCFLRPDAKIHGKAVA